jgi:hypothetical protein
MAVRRRRSSITSEINDFAKAFKAGWSMMDMVRGEGSKGRKLSAAEERRRDEDAERERYQTDAEREAGGRARGGGGDSMDRSNRAIAGIESGGRYDAVGPDVKRSGGRVDRAYGKYQVMGDNIPTWTKAHYGKSLTPEQFLSNEKAQDAVFEGRFGYYKHKYGSAEKAARAWFAGEGGMNDDKRKDVLGTTVRGYADKFRSKYDQAAIPDDKSRPEQVASADDMSSEPGYGDEQEQPAEQPEQTAFGEQETDTAAIPDETADFMGDEDTMFAARGGMVYPRGNRRPVGRYAEGGYVDRVDPEDEVYQERTRANYEGLPVEDDEYEIGRAHV